MKVVFLFLLFSLSLQAQVPYFPISEARGVQKRPSVAILDTTFFVVFEDSRSLNWDLYGTPVSLKGAVLAPEGVPLITEPSKQSYPFIRGGSSYFLLLFSDDRDAENWPSLYYTKISPSGEVLDSSGVLLLLGSEPDPSGWNGAAFTDPSSTLWVNDIFLCAYTRCWTWWMEANTWVEWLFLNPVTDERWISGWFYDDVWGGCAAVSSGIEKLILVGDIWQNSFVHFIYDTSSAGSPFYLPEQFYCGCMGSNDPEPRDVAYGAGDFFLINSGEGLWGAHFNEWDEEIGAVFPIDTLGGSILNVTVCSSEETSEFFFFWAKGGAIYSGKVLPFFFEPSYGGVVAYGDEPRAVSRDGKIFLVWSRNEDVYGTLLNSDFEFLYPCGDVNSDEIVDQSDLSFLANYIFSQGVPPLFTWTADLNSCDGVVDANDLLYLASYLFSGGPQPDCCEVGKKR